MARNEPGDPANRLCVNFGADINRKERTGLQCDGVKAKYVSREDLYKYWTCEKIGEILRVSETIADSQTVRRYYLQVLSTLVDVQATYHIPALQYLNQLISHDDHDATLPWLEPRHGFKDEVHFNLFRQLQWRFCPVAINRDRPMNNRLLDRCAILPLSQLDSTTEPEFRVKSTQRRESALTAFKVNAEDVAHPAPTGQEHAAIYNLVFKTYRNELVFNDELQAYHALHKNEHIIDYYGSFHWFTDSNDRCSTIILELAEEGSLLDLYKRNAPPTSNEGIRKFWTGYVGLIEGLVALHNRTNERGYTVIHQDLKPSNVLISRSKAQSPSTLHLKIGDLGASSVRFGSETQRDFGRDAGAGKTYGPPELHLSHRISFTVGTYVDIWALACILLEAAVWVSFGEVARQSFREDRIRETRELSDEHQAIGNGDAFHDGEKTLKCVQAIHKRIFDEGRRSDDITHQIVWYILKECLVEQELRPSAMQIRGKLREMLLQRHSTDPHGLPSSPSSGQQRQSWQQTPPAVNNGGDYMHGHGMEQTGRTLSRHARRTAPPLHDPGENQVPSPSSPLNEPVFSDPPMQTSPPQLPPTGNKRLPELPNDSSMQLQNGTHSHPAPDPGYAQGPSPQSTAPPYAPLNQDTPPTSTIKHSSHPPVSPRELHDWIKKDKDKKGSAGELRGWNAVRDSLEGRDFIIIVDNSRFMQVHHDDLFSLVKDLTYLMKFIDRDGVEVIFTSSPTVKHKVKTSSKMEELLKTHVSLRNNSICHMEHTMDTVVKDVKQRLRKLGEKQQSWRGSAFRGNSSKLKAMSIYVFTNGIWDDSGAGTCGVDQSIENLIAYMKTNGVSRTEAAIQFVRFGSSEKGMRRLIELDDDLPKRGANKNL
ncbi:hypothetical protein PG990_004246 [Apiospora arundinis]